MLDHTTGTYVLKIVINSLIYVNAFFISINNSINSTASSLVIYTDLFFSAYFSTAVMRNFSAVSIFSGVTRPRS